MTIANRKLIVLLASTVSLTQPAATALAQTDAKKSTSSTAKAGDEVQLEEIVVSGIRYSLQTSAETKKNALEIMESISAEDIGKLPDPNVAETLTRIPGVQGYRYGGEGASPVGNGSGLTIRGMSGQTASRIDGREFFTAGAREFNIESAIPGMIAGIDVYKNPSAEHIEGGIGGLINVRTRMPLDFEGLVASGAVAERYSDLSEKTKPEVFGLISNRWQVGDGDFGVLAAFNYQESFNRSDSNPAGGGLNARRAVRGDAADFVSSGGNAAYAGRTDVWYLADVNISSNPFLADNITPNPAYVENTPLATRQSYITALAQTSPVFQEDIHRIRRGASIAAQWKPSDELEIYLQGFYNYYLYDQRYRFMFFGDSRTVQNLVTAPFNFDENFLDRNRYGGANNLMAGQRLVSGTFLGSSVSSTTGGAERRPYESWVTALGAKWQPSDALNLRFDFSYLNSDQKQDNRSVSANTNSGLTWDISRVMVGAPHQMGISGPSLANPSNFYFNSYSNGTNTVYKDDGYAAQFDLKYALELPVLNAIKSGLRYSTHKANFHDYSGAANRSLTTGGNISLASGQGTIEIAPNNWLDGEAGYSGGYLVYNPLALWGDTVSKAFPNAGIPSENALPENIQNRRYTSEKSYAAYVVGELNYNDRLKGNVGVRLVKTDLFARSMVRDYTSSSIVYVPYGRSNSYTNVLPSLNLGWYFTPDTIMRFGYAKAITRPGLSDLNPNISITPATGTGSGGNPDQKPLKADSFDLTFEQYFSPINYVSAGVFYKNVDGFPFGRDQCISIPFAPAPSAKPCGNDQYLITIQDNMEKGHVQGAEFAFQTFFDFLPGVWKNFGTSGSYTYLTAKNPARINGLIVDVPMPFQSKNSWTLSGLYENKLMSARLVYTYRSDYVLFGIANNPSDGRYVKGYGLLDAAVNFNLPSDLTLSFTGSNLTNKGLNRYAGEPGAYASDFERQHYVNGRVYGVGLRYKFGK